MSVKNSFLPQLLGKSFTALRGLHAPTTKLIGQNFLLPSPHIERGKALCMHMGDIDVIQGFACSLNLVDRSAFQFMVTTHSIKLVLHRHEQGNITAIAQS